VRTFSAMLALVLLSGCGSQYVRADGAPIDPAQEKATLAQCKGEGAIAGDPGDLGGREAAVVTACMARNGYILAR
jgi:hypothetical protein